MDQQVPAANKGKGKAVPTSASPFHKVGGGTLTGHTNVLELTVGGFPGVPWSFHGEFNFHVTITASTPSCLWMRHGSTMGKWAYCIDE